MPDALIDHTERDTARWAQVCDPGENLIPCDLVAGKAYKGSSSAWLACAADRRG